MARGGFIQPEVAIARLDKALGSRNAAKVGIYDALVSGALLARGSRILKYKYEPTPPGAFRDLATTESTPVLSDPEDVPTKYWSGFLIIHVSDWDWECGHLRNPNWADHLGYHDVVLKEKHINAIIERVHPTPAPTEKRRRRRPWQWEEWVAAVAILASRGGIDGRRNEHDFIADVDHILEDWGVKTPDIDFMKDGTIMPTVRKVRERFRDANPGGANSFSHTKIP